MQTTPVDELITLKTAKALGLEVPLVILAIADEVIDQLQCRFMARRVIAAMRDLIATGAQRTLAPSARQLYGFTA